jgi:hypothetical protein
MDANDKLRKSKQLIINQVGFESFLIFLHFFWGIPNFSKTLSLLCVQQRENRYGKRKGGVILCEGCNKIQDKSQGNIGHNKAQDKRQ